MGIIRIRNPVEYSYLQWINGFPDSWHWKDMERFYRFVKTVCRYNAKKWKDPKILENRILKDKPFFDKTSLEKILGLYSNLIDFHKTQPQRDTRLTRQDFKDGCYLEIRVKNGVIHKRERPTER